MPDGNLARYVAPAVLVVAALAILITWQTSVSDEAPPEPAGQDRPVETTENAEEGEDDGGSNGGEGGGTPEPEGEDPEGEVETYTVQAGDSLSTIAARTGVDVQTLLEANENVNPQQLQAGDELQLAP